MTLALCPIVWTVAPLSNLGFGFLSVFFSTGVDDIDSVSVVVTGTFLKQCLRCFYSRYTENLSLGMIRALL